MKLEMLTWALGLGLLSFSGCVGDVGSAADGAEQGVALATFELQSDPLGALQLKDCLKSKGPQTCRRYPNPLGCDRLTIQVGQLGGVEGVCQLENGQQEKCGGAGGRLPVSCSWDQTQRCANCQDVFGKAIFTSCARGAGIAGDPVVQPPAQAQQPAAPPPQNGEVTCDPQGAANQFAAEFNKILVDQKVNLTFQPNLSNVSQTAQLGHFGKGTCDDNAERVDRLTQRRGTTICQAEADGTQVCRCAYMTNLAMDATCKSMKAAGCLSGAWEGALYRAAGDAADWLSEPTYKRFWSASPQGTQTNPPQGNSADDVEGTGSGTGSGTGEGTGSGGPECTGSPLVLDLGDDGVHPTSLEEGVTFDLFGRNQVRTAWVKGDDALLVLDRNHNGQIDNGSELFGEAMGVDGKVTLDGFQALGLLDQKAHGGNGDGQVDSRDKRFAELQVWNDRNADGLTQPGELRSLAQAGIQSVSLGITHTGNALDQHGNDLGTRGQFVWKNGNIGLMVDVYFQFRAPAASLISSLLR